jgi:hypothetical protein
MKFWIAQKLRQSDIHEEVFVKVEATRTRRKLEPDQPAGLWLRRGMASVCRMFRRYRAGYDRTKSRLRVARHPPVRRRLTNDPPHHSPILPAHLRRRAVSDARSAGYAPGPISQRNRADRWHRRGGQRLDRHQRCGRTCQLPAARRALDRVARPRFVLDSCSFATGRAAIVSPS